MSCCFNFSQRTKHQIVLDVAPLTQMLWVFLTIAHPVGFRSSCTARARVKLLRSTRWCTTTAQQHSRREMVLNRQFPRRSDVLVYTRRNQCRTMSNLPIPVQSWVTTRNRRILFNADGRRVMREYQRIALLAEWPRTENGRTILAQRNRCWLHGWT